MLYKRYIISILSLLSWERGLKSVGVLGDCICSGVAPLVGAWIEIDTDSVKGLEWDVAPLVGAWIEIQDDIDDVRRMLVAPLVGAWIEIPKKKSYP